MKHFAEHEEGLTTRLPFHYKACGGTAGSRDLTDNPRLVDCPSCLALYQEALSNQAEEPHSPAGEGEPIASDHVAGGGDVDEFADAFDDDVEEEESDSVEGDGDQTAMIRGMLLGIIEGAEVNPRGARWMFMSSDDDEEGVLDIGGDIKTGQDVRDMVSPSDRERLAGLCSMLSMVQAEALGKWLLGVIDGLASDNLRFRIVASQQVKAARTEQREANEDALVGLRGRIETLEADLGRSQAELIALKKEKSAATAAGGGAEPPEPQLSEDTAESGDSDEALPATTGAPDEPGEGASA